MATKRTTHRSTSGKRRRKEDSGQEKGSEEEVAQRATDLSNSPLLRRRIAFAGLESSLIIRPGTANGRDDG